MTGVFVLFGGILLIGAIIAFLDWRTRRKDREAETRRSA
jgi:hypothetical protein